MFLRAENNYDTDKASLESGLACKDPSLTHQAGAKESDINEIMRQFGKTGQLPQNIRIPLPEDFYDIQDFHSAQDAILAANAEFARLPAAIRARFDNDPGAFVDFATAPENLPAMVDMGLAPKPVPEAPEEPKAP